MTGAPEPEPLAGGAYLRLVLIGAVIGVPAALVAAGFLALVHEFEDVLWHDLPDQLGYSSVPWFLVVGLPVVGAGLVAVARRALPGDGGHEPLFDVSPTLAVAVGTAAGVAAATRLLVSSLLIAALLVGTVGLDAIPAAVLAAAGAWLTVTALDKRPAAA